MQQITRTPNSSTGAAGHSRAQCDSNVSHAVADAVIRANDASGENAAGADSDRHSFGGACHAGSDGFCGRLGYDCVASPCGGGANGVFFGVVRFPD